MEFYYGVANMKNMSAKYKCGAKALGQSLALAPEGEVRVVKP